MEIIICMLAIILICRGVYLIVRMRLIWLMLCLIQKLYNKKTYGKVMAIEKGKDVMKRPVIRPVVEYKLEEQGETFRRGIPCCLGLSTSKFAAYYPKNIHVGDKVTVWYMSDDVNTLFAQRYMPQTRLLFSMLLPACFYIAVAIGGICYVING